MNPLLEIGVACLAAVVAVPTFSVLRGSLAEQLRCSCAYLENVRRETCWWLADAFAGLPSRGAYHLGGALLAVGLPEVVGLLLCSGAYFHETSRDVWLSGALALEVAFAAAFLFDLWRLQRRDADEVQTAAVLPPALLRFLLAQRLLGLAAGIWLRFCGEGGAGASAYGRRLLVVSCGKLANFAFDVILPCFWSLDVEYLPYLPVVWALGAADALISLACRPIFMWSLFGVVRDAYLENALISAALGLVIVAASVPVQFALIAGSISRMSANLQTAHIKDD
eukprot:TRINITY_DN19610_c0_g2_i1.p1 TRINITY_DN19610_c0_g2~~TRINITY_DN19610_c0_g2_i1.p1  ORF type:complete len:297 (-),score=54.85 TRINITY_DN19610_c0_g2_i1:393-1235(-)